MDQEFLGAVESLVREVLPEALNRLEAKLSAESVTADSIRVWAMDLPQKEQREAVSRFATRWKSLGSSLSQQSVLAAVASLRFAEERRTKAEICWSGPTDSLHGLRSTNVAYRELMSSAKRSVLILTFTIGEVESLRNSLESVIERGVSVRIIVEDFDVFSQESRREKIQHFGPVVTSKAQIFVWPTSNRRMHEGRFYGSMHVKCLIVDEEGMLLTSANWSGAAMQDNMELGVLIRDAERVRASVQHFDQLVTSNTLISIIEPF